MRALVFATLLAFGAACEAADRQLVLAPAIKPPAGEKRVALVIGNAAYATAPLRNPVNDARAIAQALAKTGFKVTVLEDGTQQAMFRAIRQFGDELLGGGVGLFYYAGHGMQVRGRNFLIPVNANIEREDEIEFQAIDANFVVVKMDTAKNGLNLLVLDACRNNPFTRSFRSASQGLAQMDAPSGTLIAFATSPGQVAADGDGQNGLYTKHLLANISKPGLPIERLFKEVRNGVAGDTSERQIPWESSSLRGEFFFVPPDPSQSPEAQKAAMQRAIDEAVKREQDKLATEREIMQRKMEDTIRQLLAKQRAELEEEMKRRGETVAALPPKPAPVAPIAVAVAKPEPWKAPEAPKPQAQVASVAPALGGAGIANPRFPRVGDRWEYAYVETIRKQPLRLDVSVTGVSAEGIVEQLQFAGDKPILRAHSAAAEIVFDERAWDFAPYLRSFDSLASVEEWRTIPYRNLVPCQAAGTSCRFSGKVAGREKVTTRAGTFDTIKVVIELNARGIAASGGSAAPIMPTWRQLTLWYSDEAKRPVKVTARTLTTGGLQPDYDLELVAYQLNAAATSGTSPGAAGAQPDIAATIRQLLAKQRAELEAEMKTRGETAPPLQVASIAPTASIAGGPDPRLPKVGDAWEYQYRDSFKADPRKRRLEVTGVSPDGILESAIVGNETSTQAYSPGIELMFVAQGVLQLSPYFLAFADLKPGMRWSSLPARNSRECNIAGVMCRFDAEVTAQENVTTPAGRFSAIKVTVDGNYNFGSTNVWRQYTFWYSAEAKRVVKSSGVYRTRVYAHTLGLMPDYEIELVSYKLN